MLNRARLARISLTLGVRRIDPKPVFRFSRLKPAGGSRQCRFFTSTGVRLAGGNPDGDEAETATDSSEAECGDVVKVGRPKNPEPYDKNAYVVRICRNLRQNDPTKYAYFAGLYGGRVGSDGVLRELGPGEKDEELIRLEEGVREAKIKEISDDSEELGLTVTGGPLATLKEQEMKIAGRKYFAENTVDYIKRALESSLELYVINHREELFEVLDMVANLNPKSLTITDEEIEKKCVELLPGWIEKTKFGLAYLFFLNRGHPGRKPSWGDDFIDQVIRQLSPDVDLLTVEEFTSLMLLLYMRYQPYKEEVLNEVLDHTILQQVVLEYMSKMIRTETELCAVVLGLRKLEGFSLYYNDLRDVIYRRLEVIGLKLSDATFKTPDKDTLSFINTCVYQMCIMLHKGNHFIRDPFKAVMQTQQSYQEALIAYDPSLGFLLSPSTCLKIASLGASRGGLHDHIVTESFLERLHLGNQVKHLSLKEMCKTLMFTTQIKNVKEEGVDLRPIILKVVKSLANEISMVSDSGEQLMNISDVRFILQSWLYLSSYEIFDDGRLASIFEQVNLLGSEHFQSNPDVPLDEQCEILGKKLSDVCFQSLFPYSYSQRKINNDDLYSVSVDQGDGYALELKHVHAKDFVRLLGSLSNTLAIYRPDFQPLLDKDKLRRVIDLVQSPVPAVVRESSLPAVPLTRRQKLMSAVYHSLGAALQRPHMVELIHILPHFREADVIIGHLAGNPMFLPAELLKKKNDEIVRAPDYGSWIVVSLDGPSKNDSVKAESQNANDISGEPERYRQLMELGYEVYVISAADQAKLLQGKGLQWAHKVLANILTGYSQEEPKPYQFQRRSSFVPKMH